jgi:type I site-specific restriction-modification system R (restriction) subunit
VNGLPLGVIELKNPADENADIGLHSTIANLQRKYILIYLIPMEY